MKIKFYVPDGDIYKIYLAVIHYSKQVVNFFFNSGNKTYFVLYNIIFTNYAKIFTLPNVLLFKILFKLY